MRNSVHLPINSIDARWTKINGIGRSLCILHDYNMGIASFLCRPIPSYSLFHAEKWERETLKNCEWAWGRG